MSYVKMGSKMQKKASMSMFIGSIITFSIIYSPQPLIGLFSDQYGVSPATSSASISITTFVLSFSMLFVFLITNRWGRKEVMSLSLLLASLFAILSAIWNNFSLFLVFRFLIGVAVAGFPSVAITYLNEEFSPNVRGRLIGIYIAGTAFGGIFGRVVAGALTDFFHWQTAIIFLGVCGLAGSIFFLLSLPKSQNFHANRISFQVWAANMKECFSNIPLLFMFITAFLLMGVFVTIFNYIGIPLSEAPYHLNQTILGLLFIVNLVGTWSSIWFGRLTDKYPRVKIVTLAITVFFIGVLLTTNDLLFLKIIGMAMVAFGFFGGHAVISGWIGRLANKDGQAQASSLFFLFYYAGSSIIGWSSGYVFHHFGWNALIYYTCVLLFFAVALTYQVGWLTSAKMQKRRKRETESRLSQIKGQ
ncbi:MFS transporter [Bacillaceae bacterium Marseille-Q3522]|nr:MFS transporter [Bacillaceae bacterium Marseille-Q3522]